jgi:hypothetical protein
MLQTKWRMKTMRMIHGVILFCCKFTQRDENISQFAYSLGEDIAAVTSALYPKTDIPREGNR